MAASFEYETLEALLDKCTDPNTGKEDWRYINAFCDRVNKDYDGPLISTKLIIRKLQTFQEKVSLMALSVLETCVKHCGKQYHQEIGKFRFLNELIKLISNKYDGSRTPETVKAKIIELFYNWSVGLQSETKIKEAYLMLKRQGVVAIDPGMPSQVEQYKLTPQPRMAVFEDEDKSKLLARLLASKHPDDLQAANRLIKNMVRQDEVKAEKLNLRVQELEMVYNNVKLLKEMLSHYSVNTPKSDLDLMKELLDSCEKLRTSLFKSAGTATDEGDESLSDILLANDNLTKVIEDYHRIVGVPGEPPNVPPSMQGVPPDVVRSSENPSNLSTLIDLDIGGNAGGGGIPTSNGEDTKLSNDLQDLVLGNSAPATTQVRPSGLAFPLPGQQNMMPGVPRFPPPPHQQQLHNPWAMNPGVAASSGAPTASMPVGDIRGMQLPGPGVYRGATAGVGMPRAPLGTTMQAPTLSPTGSAQNASWSPSVVNRMKPDDPKPKQPSPFDILGQEAMNAHKETQNKKAEEVKESKKDAVLLDLDESAEQQAVPQIPAPTPPQQQQSNPMATPTSTTQPNKDTPLEELSVPTDQIQPGNLPPMNVLDKNNVKTVMHFAKDSSGSLRADIHVVVVSTMNTNTTPLKNFAFQCAAPKSMKIKLQAPTSNELPAYNPILPPSAITQVMLLANPAKDRIRLKFRISYELNDAKTVETGDLDNFPIL